MKTRFVGYAAAWVLLAACITIGLGQPNWPYYHRMTIRGVAGTGSVLQLLPETHDTVRYEYRVGPYKYFGVRTCWAPNRQPAQLHIGDPLVVYYDPQHPEDSVLGCPKVMLNNETTSIALAATGIPSLALIGWALRKARH